MGFNVYTVFVQQYMLYIDFWITTEEKGICERKEVVFALTGVHCRENTTFYPAYCCFSKWYIRYFSLSEKSLKVISSKKTFLIEVGNNWTGGNYFSDIQQIKKFSCCIFFPDCRIIKKKRKLLMTSLWVKKRQKHSETQICQTFDLNRYTFGGK